MIGMPAPSLIHPTDDGLHCAEGGFHLDPWRPVERAVVTHAHSDHASPGCGSYLCSEECEPVLRLRIGAAASINAVPFGLNIDVGGVRVSLHPAGHILGSAQVRVERRLSTDAAAGPVGEVAVFTGDFKDVPDRTCTPFEPVRCHTLIMESTFALPVYRWPSQDSVFAEINAWWRANRDAGRTSLVFAYALGKAQRVLAGLDPSIGPIGAHGSVRRMNLGYAARGVALPETRPAAGAAVKALQGVGLIVAPPSANGSTWARKLGGREGVSTAFVSGWMMVRGSRRRRAVDRGFVLSDHADWPGLLRAIDDSGAERVGVTHGFSDTLVRWLGQHGRDAYIVPSRYEGERTENDDPAPEPDDPRPAPEASP